MGKAGIKQRKSKATNKQQSERFREAALDHGADQSMEEFERTFKKIARQAPSSLHREEEAEEGQAIPRSNQTEEKG
jgi:hypothetical protein